MAGGGSPTPPAVVLGNTGSAISVTRSLGRRGVPVWVVGARDGSLAPVSRYCTRFTEVRPDHWLDWLEREGPRGAVILPPGDLGVELIVRNRERLVECGYRLPDTVDEVSLAMLDKTRTYELARAAGIACPRTWEVSRREDVEALGEDVPFPCALKPVHSHLFSAHFDVKVLLARDREELSAHLERTLALGLEMLVTEVIPGPEDATWTFTTYLDADGEPLFGLTRNKLRSFPVHFGTNTYLVTRWSAETADEGLRFLRGVGMRGLAHVEFKRDPRDGRLKLIECNHRFVNIQELLRRAGLDVPWLVYRQALGRSPGALPRWREGVRLWFPARDLRAARAYREEGVLTWPEWLRSLAHLPTYTPVLSFDDLRPTGAAVWRKARRRLSPRGGAGP